MHGLINSPGISPSMAQKSIQGSICGIKEHFWFGRTTRKLFHASGLLLVKLSGLFVRDFSFVFANSFKDKREVNTDLIYAPDCNKPSLFRRKSVNDKSHKTFFLHLQPPRSTLLHLCDREYYIPAFCSSNAGHTHLSATAIAMQGEILFANTAVSFCCIT